LGLPYSKDELEKIEDDILKRLEEFKTKELPEDAFVLYIDAYHGKLKESSGKVRKCCIYTVLGIDLEGNREVYGFYIVMGSENKDEWIKIFNDLISRGLKRILLIVSDDFSGLDGAIEAIFPKTDHQLCFVHLQRNVKRNMSKEDSKEFNRKLRETYIYYSNNFEEAKDKLDNILEEYKNRYPSFISYLLKKEGKYLSFMKYPQRVRRSIYTTNIIENFNSLLERIRHRLGGYFASKQILGINVMLQCEKLEKTKWKKPHPIIRGELYEINQIFNLRFYENNMNLKTVKNSQTQCS
ncbi:MAG: IS256 family transposase, partial [Candidatus Schekmanbacteria bacterium]